MCPRTQHTVLALCLSLWVLHPAEGQASRVTYKDIELPELTKRVPIIVLAQLLAPKNGEGGHRFRVRELLKGPAHFASLGKVILVRSAGHHAAMMAAMAQRQTGIMRSWTVLRLLHPAGAPVLRRARQYLVFLDETGELAARGAFLPGSRRHEVAALVRQTPSNSATRKTAPTLLPTDQRRAKVDAKARVRTKQVARWSECAGSAVPGQFLGAYVCGRDLIIRWSAAHNDGRRARPKVTVNNGQVIVAASFHGRQTLCGSAMTFYATTIKGLRGRYVVTQGPGIHESPEGNPTTVRVAIPNDGSQCRWQRGVPRTKPPLPPWPPPAENPAGRLSPFAD